MSIAITVNSADYSASAIGWEAPTTAQPAAALFIAAGAVKNLAAGGSAPATVGSAPPVTAGVKGTSLPFVTLSYAKALDTLIGQPVSSTMMGLIRIPDPTTNAAPIVSSDQSTSVGGWVAIGMRSSEINNFAGAGSATQTLNETLTGFGDFQIHAWQTDFSTTTLRQRYVNRTLGLDVSDTSTTITAQTAAGASMRLGIEPDAATTAYLQGTYDMSAFLIWDSLITDADIASAATWLQQYAQVYGVSV